MRYILNQELFSWGDDFSIKDESGRDVFLVDGKVFSFRNELSLRDTSGNELALIKQKLLSLGSTYEIHKGEQLRAVIKQSFLPFHRHNFTLDVSGPDDMQIEGDFFAHEFSFRRGERIVAKVSKKWFSWTDAYGVDVADEEDAILILASTVAIDLACHHSSDDD